jgi:hypothetical protein
LFGAFHHQYSGVGLREGPVVSISWPVPGSGFVFLCFSFKNDLFIKKLEHTFFSGLSVEIKENFFVPDQGV